MHLCTHTDRERQFNRWPLRCNTHSLADRKQRTEEGKGNNEGGKRTAPLAHTALKGGGKGTRLNAPSLALSSGMHPTAQHRIPPVSTHLYLAPYLFLPPFALAVETPSTRWPAICVLTCRAIRGYVQRALRHVKPLPLTHLLARQRLLTGCDEAEENVWVAQHSKTPIEYTSSHRCQ